MLKNKIGKVLLGIFTFMLLLPSASATTCSEVNLRPNATSWPYRYNESEVIKDASGNYAFREYGQKYNSARHYGLCHYYYEGGIRCEASTTYVFSCKKGSTKYTSCSNMTIQKDCNEVSACTWSNGKCVTKISCGAGKTQSPNNNTCIINATSCSQVKDSTVCGTNGQYVTRGGEICTWSNGACKAMPNTGCTFSSYPNCPSGQTKSSYGCCVWKKASSTPTQKVTQKPTQPTKEYINKYRYLSKGFLASSVKTKYKCGDSVYIDYCTVEGGTKYCYYHESGTPVRVYRDKLSDEPTKDTTCNENNTKPTQPVVDEEPKEELMECKNEKVTDQIGPGKYPVCYPKNMDEDDIKNKYIKKKYKCAEGYVIDETSLVADDDEVCDSKNCIKTYSVDCISTNPEEVNYRPSIAVTSGNIGSDGRTGIISVTASSKKGNIEKYYVSNVYKAPTKTSSGWVEVTGSSFTVSETPGIYYFWVMDSEGNISLGVGGAVFDTVNSNTTINTLELYDTDGGLVKPNSGTAYKVKGITNSNYVRLSNNLVNESVLAENGFNPFAMEYKLEVASPTISVYATLTSTDAKYVPGYEPRTVNLDYGMNTILIKIENNEGKTRTYTILVNRVDDRKADNTLRDLSVDTGKIDFNSNKTEYKIEIPAKTTKVNVNATIGSDKASFVEGFEPGVVSIKGNTTVKLIKVKSETGSTRTYVLTFVKEKTDIIEDKTLMLADLVIPNVYVAFEKEIANYNISVPYEKDLIDIKYVLKDKNSSAQTYIKSEMDLDYREVSNLGIKLEEGINSVEIKVINQNGDESVYRLTIIRKEFGLGISDDTTLNELRVLGYDINFEPNKKEYTVKIKQEKSLVITAIPSSNRAEVFIRGNDELTGFSTVRVKVVAENGKFATYSIDIKKDAFNKTIEIAAIVVGVVIILGSSCIIVIKNKNKKRKEYFEE